MHTRDDRESDRVLRLKKVLVRTTAVIGMISWFYTAYLYYNYRARMPTEPQPRAGRTYPVDLKGDTFYTTKTEQRPYYATVHLLRECDHYWRHELDSMAPLTVACCLTRA